MAYTHAMFNPNQTVIRAFVSHATSAFQHAFADVSPAHIRTLETATQTAMETLLRCDCPYHDIQHTIIVTDVGQNILQGRQLAKGDLSADDWLHAVVAMLFHDIGYLRELLAEDTPESSVIGPDGSRVQPPMGATDAFMAPYHVDRGALYIRERFAHEELIDVDIVAECIEMTRFPVPAEPTHNATETLPGLVRAADLVGQMADPQYLQKLSRLFAEFVEIGEARRLNFKHAGDLRTNFPEFFYNQVHPYIGSGIDYLKRTQDGQQWIANLYHHLHVNSPDQKAHPRFRAPELVVDNVTS
ncbi:MAG: hypothetical protein P8L31_05040 [Pseudomonadales bacterium]|nr:hypothetical protein [Pseudomonadales bacterium]